MKKLISLICVFLLLLALAVPALAEDAEERTTFVEVDGPIVKLWNDGSEEDIVDNLEEFLVYLAVENLGITGRQGMVYTTLDSVCIAQMTDYDPDYAKLHNAEPDMPFTFIRFAFTVDNQSKFTIRIPKDYAWIVTSQGEIVSGRIGEMYGVDFKRTLEPGETTSAYLFFSADAWPHVYSFYSLFLNGLEIVDGGGLPWPISWVFQPAGPAWT